MLKMSASIIGANTIEDQLKYISAIKDKNIAFEITPTKDLSLLKDCNIVSIQSILKYDKQIFNSIANCDEVISLLADTMKVVDVFNIDNIVFGLPKARFVNNELEFNNSKYFFNKFTETYNHSISIEQNCKAYMTNFLTNLDDTVEYVRCLDNELVKVNFDLGSFIYNKGDLNTIKDNLDLINHVHISAPYLKSISSYTKDLTEIIELLYTNKYTKYVSLEEVSNDTFYEDLNLFYKIVYNLA